MLIWATLANSEETVNKLINQGANINIQDKDGKTALHFASQEYYPGIVELLLESGADPEIKDKHGNTPLSDAVFYSRGRGDVIKTLIKYGADKTVKNNHGISPEALAKTISNYGCN